MNNTGNETIMTNANNYVTQEQILRRKWKPFNDNPAIIFAKVGAALMLNRKRLSTNSFLVDNNTMAYVIDTNKWDYRFVKVIFDNIYLPSLAQVGALPSFNAEDVENLEIDVPRSRKEGEEIGKFFFEIDSLLTLHQRSWTTDPCSNKPGQRSHDQIDVFVLELLNDVEVGSLGCVHG